MENHPTTQSWLRKLHDAETASQNDVPNYWLANPRSLFTTSNVHSLSFGTGETIYTHSVFRAIAEAESEIILVTCFWTRSPTLTALNSALLSLHTARKCQRTMLRVRICLSSLSLFQKLFHTSSLRGRTYGGKDWWRGTLGLPPPIHIFRMDLKIKSVFARPFSVMHPKFTIIDRKRVFLPSCNVSWEEWFEGCVELSGPVVGQFVEFWMQFWASEADRAVESEDRRTGTTEAESSGGTDESIPSIFLPSPHHRNPNFAILPWRPCVPPPTPLNTFLLSAFENAKRNIYIQTPNLTSPPVLSALLAALQRGVDVTILTSERLMVLEQLVTAGTTTQRCVRKLAKRHKRLVTNYAKPKHGDAVQLESASHTPRPGRLTIWFYCPMTREEPVQSHLKATVVDEEWTVLGSGNMDRASWFTSQELGVAFFSADFAGRVREEVDSCMRRRTKTVYDGGV